MITAGADMLIMRHPGAAAKAKEIIAELMGSPPELRELEIPNCKTQK